HQDSELASRRFRRYRLARLDLAEDVLGDELYDAIRRTFDALEDEVARDHLLELLTDATFTDPRLERRVERVARDPLREEGPSIVWVISIRVRERGRTVQRPGLSCAGEDRRRSSGRTVRIELVDGRFAI